MMLTSEPELPPAGLRAPGPRVSLARPTHNTVGDNTTAGRDVNSEPSDPAAVATATDSLDPDPGCDIHPPSLNRSLNLTRSASERSRCSKIIVAKWTTAVPRASDSDTAGCGTGARSRAGVEDEELWSRLGLAVAAATSLLVIAVAVAVAEDCGTAASASCAQRRRSRRLNSQGHRRWRRCV